MLPSHQISVGANGRTRTDTARLGRPACRRYTTFALLVRPTGIEPVPPRWQRGMPASTPRPNRRRLLADVPTSFSCQRPCSFRAGGQQGIRTQTALIRGQRGYSPPADHPLVLPDTLLATAPGFEPGPESVGISDAPVTPRCRVRPDSFWTQFSLQTSLEIARVLRPKTKKAF